MTVLFDLTDHMIRGMVTEDIYEQGDLPVPPMILASHWPNAEARSLLGLGMRLWMLGDFDAAAASMLRAVELLERDELPVFALWILLELGSAQRRVHPARASTTLTRALGIQQDLRTRIHDADCA